MSIVEQVIFPLDEQWQVDERGYSSALSYQVVWLSALVPYAEVAQILNDVGQMPIGSTTIWELNQTHSERLHQSQLKEQAHVSVERTRWQSEQYDPFLCRCVSMDGGMVCILGEGWKELKVGVVSGFEQNKTSDEAQVRLTNMDYRAVIGSVDEFEAVLWALAVKQLVPYAGRLLVVADGAQWIWRLVSNLFPVCVQILDYYHAKQHLAQAAHACYPDDEGAAQSWFKQMSDCLFQGEIWKIIAHLEAHQQATSYFVNQQRRMQYQQFRAAGYPIGSGAVESAIKQFKQRLTGAGMRWSRVGAERMVTIRAAVMSGTLQDLWQHAA